MIKIISYGDCILEGDYFLHSSFTKISNYFSEQGFMLSVTDSTLYVSPNTIIVDQFFFEPKRILFTSEFIEFDNYKVLLDIKQKNKSKFIFKEITNSEIETQLKNLDKILFPISENYLFLKIIYEIKHLSNSAIEQGIYNSFEKGIGFLKKNDLFQGLKFIKGIGTGLTPSGDDFIAGIVIASFIIEKKLNKNLTDFRQSISDFMNESNIYSKNFLKYIVTGNFNDYFKNFLESFYSTNYSNLKDSVYKLQKVGASSGIDVLAGFIFTLKYLFYDN